MTTYIPNQTEGAGFLIHNFCVLFLFILFPSTGNAFESLKPLYTTIIDSAQKIQELEKKVNTLHCQFLEHSKKEDNLLKSLNFDPKKLMLTLHHLRHLAEYSPTLAALSSQNSEDLINATILMRSFIPELANRYKDTLGKLKALSVTREEKKSLHTDLTTHHSYFQKKQLELRSFILQKQQIKSKFSFISHLAQSTRVQKIPLEYKNIFIQYVINKKSQASESSVPTAEIPIPLRAPVLFLPLQEENEISPPLSCRFPIKSTLPSLVTAPCQGSVLFVGLLTSGQHFLILHHDTYFVVLTGINSLLCQKGQTLLTGEPLGYISPSSARTPILTLELWQNNKQIAPSLYTNGKI